MRPSLLATALLATACVPSHRVVAEGDYYFEQCYGRDFEPRAFDREREACWESWLAHYTRHQPASRVDYALRRVEDLQAGGPQPALPGIGAPVPIDPGVESAPAPAAAATPTALPKGCEPACDAYSAHCARACPADTHDCQRMCVVERARCLAGCH